MADRFALLGIPFAVFALLIVAMLVFSRRAQTAMYSQAEGQPGAAGWLLQQQLKGDWRLTQASPAPPRWTPCTASSAVPASC